MSASTRCVTLSFYMLLFIYIYIYMYRFSKMCLPASVEHADPCTRPRNKLQHNAAIFDGCCEPGVDRLDQGLGGHGCPCVLYEDDGSILSVASWDPSK